MNVKTVASLLFFSILSFSPFVAQAEMSQKMQAKDNGEVIAWVEAIDNFEVNAAQVALTKTLDSAVKNYATTLDSDHNQNLKQVTALGDEMGGKPIETRALTKFKRGGDKQLKKLTAENNGNFQKVFINDMIAGHTDALKKVDRDLMKKAKNDKLKSFLQETRAMIAHHLEMAKEIKKTI